MAMKPISKKLNEKQKEILARKLGYDGPMNMFEEFVKSDAAMGAKYNSVISKYMARGGMAKKYAAGGIVTPAEVDPELAAIAKEVGYEGPVYPRMAATVRALYNNYVRAKQRAEASGKSSDVDRVERDKQKVFDRLNDNATGVKSLNDKYLAEYNEAEKTIQGIMSGQIPYKLADFNKAQTQLKSSIRNLTTQARVYGGVFDATGMRPELGDVDSQQVRQDLGVTISGRPIEEATPKASTIQRVEPEPITVKKPDITFKEADGTVYNVADGRPTTTTPPTATGFQPSGTRLPLPENSEIAADGTVMMRLPDGRLVNPNAPGISPDDPNYPSTSTGAGTTTPPATTATPMVAAERPVAPDVPTLTAEKIGAPTTDQLVTGQPAPATAATVQPTTVGTTATVADVAPKEAATVTTATAIPGVTEALKDVKPATGTVSEQAQIQAQTMDPRTTAVSDLQAATGEATMVQAPAPRTVQEGEMIAGPTVDMGRVEETLSQAQAAQGVVTDEMTVAGQIQKLTANFDATNPPTWAAGAIRNVNAVLTQRGMGASSLAGQAIVQAALESALPIAAADAKVYQDMGIQNLANRQQIAVLTAQQRAAFLGQEFDQAFQTRVTNAATISEIANINFTAEQQIALENARLTNTVNLANLSNQQALVMAEAAQIANLEMANLNNRQQAQVLNAQAFLQMDMANLANEQQTELFKAQSMVNSLLTDAAAENAARQFNASSINQVNQFYDGLTAQIQQFNAAQTNGINQFNVSQINAVAEFNASSQNARDQFNAEYRRIIDQSNVEWRRNIALADTAAVNRANEINAANALGITTIDYNNTWQQYRDSLEMAWKTSEGAMDREVQLALGVLSKNAAIESAKYAVEAEKAKALGALAAVGLDKSGLFEAGGKAIMSALGSGKASNVALADYLTNNSPWVEVKNASGLNDAWTTYYNGSDTLEIDFANANYYLNDNPIALEDMPGFDYWGGSD